MRCKTCNYGLWNLPARICPECGTPFLPSQFEFVPNSVRFCCPHCRQDYYGTSEKGHLVPDAFNCVRCGNPVRMDQMILRPTAGVDEERTKTDVVPWVDTAPRGFFSRWFGTIGMALVLPGRLMKALPADVTIGRPFWFAVLTGMVGYGIGIGSIFLFVAAVGGGALAVGATLLLIPVIAAVILLAWALATHVLLLLTGTTERGLPGTLICHCFASAPQILISIPLLGFYLIPVAAIWWAVVGSIMIATRQKVSGLRATFAVLLPPLVVVVSITLWFFIVALPFMQSAIASGAAASARISANGGSPLGAGNARNSVTAIVVGLRAYAAAHNGAEPPHALALLADNNIYPFQLFAGGAPASPLDEVIGSTTITDFPRLRRSEQDLAIKNAAAALPPSPVGHRLGDVVFTYHGIDVSANSTAPPNLWLLVFAPRANPPPPAAAAPTEAPTPPNTPTPQLVNASDIWVGQLDGTAVHIGLAKWTAALATQNQLRARIGLAPIPDFLAQPELLPIDDLEMDSMTGPKPKPDDK